MTTLFTRRSLGRGAVALVAGGVLHGQGARASALAPAESVVLTMSGRINAPDEEDGVARFDRPMLGALGTASFETTCPWFDGLIRFEGPRMDRLLDAVDARGDRVMAYGLNGQATELARDDFARYGVILATTLNGIPLRTRSKGLLFVVYPYDSPPELNDDRFYSRSAWQVARLDVR